MDEQALSAIRDLLDRQPIAANVIGALIAAIVSGDPEVTVVARSGFPPPFASDSRVLLYSFSKTIVAAALLRLVAAGRLSLHDTLGRFSNRPFEVKHFQTIRHCNVDVAHGLALLFGIGTRALPSWDPRTRWNNLMGGLAVKVTGGPSGHANSPRPSSREGHHSTARWSSSVLLLD